MITEVEIRNLVKRRHASQLRKNEERGTSSPSYEDIERVVRKSVKNGFQCFYCNKALKLRDEKPYKDVASLEHKLPVRLGGTSCLNNLELVCHECNIVKGTLKEATFRSTMKFHMQNGTWDEYKNEMWNSSMVRMLERGEGVIHMNLAKIGAGWINESQKSGKKYIGIVLDEKNFSRVAKEDWRKICLFKNEFKDKENSPDYTLMAPAVEGKPDTTGVKKEEPQALL